MTMVQILLLPLWLGTLLPGDFGGRSNNSQKKSIAESERGTPIQARVPELFAADAADDRTRGTI